MDWELIYLYISQQICIYILDIDELYAHIWDATWHIIKTSHLFLTFTCDSSHSNGKEKLNQIAIMSVSRLFSLTGPTIWYPVVGSWLFLKK